MLNGKLSISKILKEYQKHKQKYWRRVLDYYGNLSNFQKAIEEAGMFHSDVGCCDRHQCRVYKESKKTFFENLQSAKKRIKSCTCFDDLYVCISRHCKNKGIGELAIYDTAMRVGAYLEKQNGILGQFKPKQVFLHNGPWDGAKKLYSQGLIKTISSRMGKKDFSHLFPDYEEWEIEEILCIYKNHF